MASAIKRKLIKAICPLGSRFDNIAEIKMPPPIYAVAIHKIAVCRCHERRTFDGKSDDRSNPKKPFESAK
jgi:hypothetical protein